MAYQELTLIVEADFHLPQQYTTESPKHVSQMLTLGALAFETIHCEAKKTQNEELVQTLQEDAKKEYEPKLKALLKEVEKMAETTERQKHQFETQLATKTDTLDSLKERLQQEQQQRLDLEKRIREEERRNREEILKEKDQRISAQEANIKQLSEAMLQLKDQLIKTNTGSQTRGKQGEDRVADYIHKAFSAVGRNEEFSLDDVGKEGHQGDLLMRWRGHKILWESKNYSKTVETKEVTKFLRDMEENPDISLGIMISLSTPIAGHHKAGGVDLEELRDGRKCVYINALEKSADPVLLLQSLKPFLEVFLETRHVVADENQLSEAELQKRLDRFEYQRSLMLRLLTGHQETMRDFKNALVNAKRKMDAQWVELEAQLKKAEYNVRLLLETMNELSVVDTEPQGLPDCFTHQSIEEYSEKDRSFIQDVMKHCEFDDDYVEESKALNALFKEFGHGEDAVKAVRLRVFKDTCWAKGATKVKGLRRKN